MIGAILAVVLAAEPLPGVNRVVILGDSITAAGLYSAYLESYFAVRQPDRAIEIINLGLPSETISGQSEPSHPWPRPNVHERLDRALRLKPDVVIACYGMNDGIYHPFSAPRFKAFQDGIDRLIDACKNRNIPLILVTPPPFDAEPIRKILKGPGVGDYGWQTPYALYQDEVLAAYAKWEKTRMVKGVEVVDAQTPILKFLAARRAEPATRDFRFADDGVHMNGDGHALIASTILRAWNAPAPIEDPRIDAKSLTAEGRGVSSIKAELGGVRFTWTTNLPMPQDPAWSDAVRTMHGSDLWIDRPILSVSGLKDGRYSLVEGTRSVGSIEAVNGVATIDLRAFPELSILKRSDEVGELIRKRERIMSPAWRDDVGHKRPGTEKGLPLAEAMKTVAPMTEKIRKLARPATLTIGLVRN